MKKTYIAPSAVCFNLVAEGMMAASDPTSIKYSSDETVNKENNVLSNDKIWDNDLWGTANKD